MRPRLLTLAAIVISLLAALGDASVAVKPDEPLYGAIAEGMWLRHDWVVPMFNGLQAWYKPPLLYWMAMGVMSVIGPSTLALRLVTVACGLMLLWATFRLTRRLFDTDTAWTAVFLLGTSLGFVEYSRAYMMDLPLAWLYVECCDRLWAAVMEGNRSAWIALGAWAG
ncbi:MAG TPA: glycosyltransferase family 39 protein, partial [Candidatus Xenobia bacterium]